MKKTIVRFLLLAMMSLLFAGCIFDGNKKEATKAATTQETLEQNFKKLIGDMRSAAGKSISKSVSINTERVSDGIYVTEGTEISYYNINYVLNMNTTSINKLAAVLYASSRNQANIYHIVVSNRALGFDKLLSYTGPADFQNDAKSQTATAKIPLSTEVLDKERNAKVTPNGDLLARIYTFSIVSPAAIGIIDESKKTIFVKVPAGTNLTNLTAEFTVATGAAVTVDGIVQVSGTMARNFTNPAEYEVSAGIAGTSLTVSKKYMVTVTDYIPNIGNNHPVSGQYSPVEELNWGIASYPLGSRISGSDATFAVYSKNASKVLLEIYDKPTGSNAKYDYWMVKGSDNIWRAKIAGIPAKSYYGFRVWGANWSFDNKWDRGNSSLGFNSDVDADGNRFNPNKVVYDPYGREMSHDKETLNLTNAGENGEIYGTGDTTYSGPVTGNISIKRREIDTGKWAPKSIIVDDSTSYGIKPEIAQKDAVVYEAHVRGLTKHDSAASLKEILSGIEGFENVQSIPSQYKGTYKGAGYMAKYLKAMGYTTIELLPVHETANDTNLDTSPSGNYWGYMTYSFFSPDRRYAYDKSAGGPTKEFKEMIKAFHDEGIEVYLDVVYNHTGEGGLWDSTNNTAEITSFRGLDNSEYYALTGTNNESYWQTTGCGNNFRADSDVGRNLILDSLTYWTDNMGVDGFRFDLAPVLGREKANSWGFSSSAKTLTDIATLAENKKVEVIAEAWDTQWPGGYQVSNFPSGWGEWNGFYRDSVRKFIKGSGNKTGGYPSLTSVMYGSYGPLERSSGNTHTGFNDQGGPHKSVNFIVAHDGFTLADTVSYSSGGEAQNKALSWPFGPSDGGSGDNDSWDCGGSQPLRRQQIRNLWAIQMFSRGVPMTVYGDEFGRTQNGNNNPYNVDSAATWNNYSMINTDAPQAVSTGGGGSYHNNLGTDNKSDSKNNLFIFAKYINSLRNKYPSLRQDNYGGDYAFSAPKGGNISDSSKAMRISINGNGTVSDGKFILLINSDSFDTNFDIWGPGTSKKWVKIIDTSYDGETNNNYYDINKEYNFNWSWGNGSSTYYNYLVKARSIVVLQQLDFLPAPVLSRGSGTFSTSLGGVPEIIFSNTTPGVTYKYTIDGTDPLTSSTATTGTKAVIPNTAGTYTLKVSAYKYGTAPSDTTTATYIVSDLPVVEKPQFQYEGSNVFGNSGGNYYKNVYITTSTTGAAIKYTTDGTLPSSTNGKTYVEGITLLKSQTIKAFAYKTGYADSETADAQFTFTPLASPQNNLGSEKWNDQTIYFALTDRFNDGDTSNNKQAPAGINDYADNGNGKLYQGGDLKGLKDKIDSGYFNNLGITAIWLTSPVKQAWENGSYGSYHGYWAQSLVDVDPHLGTMQEMKEMVSAAHSKGIKIIMDVVINHMGPLFYYDLNGDGTPDSNEYEPSYNESGYDKSKLKWLEGISWADGANRKKPMPLEFRNPEYFSLKGGNATSGSASSSEQLYGDFAGLRDVNTANADVREKMKEIFKWWIMQTDIDGYRIDTVKHVETDFWTDFCGELRTWAKTNYSKDLYMVGEIYSGDTATLGSYTTNNMLDSILGYNMAESVFDWNGGSQNTVFKGISRKNTNTISLDLDATKSTSGLNSSSVHTNGDGLNARQKIGYFIDNHDLYRYINDNSKTANAAASASELNNLKDALSWLFTWEGIPVLYYGTEQNYKQSRSIADGGEHGNNPSDTDYAASAGLVNQGNRPNLWQISNDNNGSTPFNESNETFKLIAGLNKIRKNNVEMRRGSVDVKWSDQDGAGSDAGLIAFAKKGATTAADDDLLVIINTGDSIRYATAGSGNDLGTDWEPGTNLDVMEIDGYMTSDIDRNKVNNGTAYVDTIQTYSQTGKTSAVYVGIPAHSIRILKKSAVQPTAASEAAKITTMTAPVSDAVAVTMPSVIYGFSVAISSSSNTAVIKTDGTVIPPETDTQVILALKVTKTSDNTWAETPSIIITVPAKSDKSKMIEKIKGYAAAANAEALTAVELTTAGATGVSESNIAGYRIETASYGSIAGINDIQTIVDRVNDTAKLAIGGVNIDGYTNFKIYLGESKHDISKAEKIYFDIVMYNNGGTTVSGTEKVQIGWKKSGGTYTWINGGYDSINGIKSANAHYKAEMNYAGLLGAGEYYFTVRAGVNGANYLKELPSGEITVDGRDKTDIKVFKVTFYTHADAEFKAIQGYAISADASAMTITGLTDAGITSLLEANIAYYRSAVANALAIADIPALQALIDNVNTTIQARTDALNTIKGYVNNNAGALTTAELTTAGVTTASAIESRLSYYKAVIGAQSSIAGLTELQSLITNVNSDIDTTDGYALAGSVLDSTKKFRITGIGNKDITSEGTVNLEIAAYKSDASSTNTEVMFGYKKSGETSYTWLAGTYVTASTFNDIKYSKGISYSILSAGDYLFTAKIRRTTNNVDYWKVLTEDTTPQAVTIDNWNDSSSAYKVTFIAPPAAFTVNAHSTADNGVNNDGKSMVTVKWADSATSTVDHYEIMAKTGSAPSVADTVAGYTNIAKGTQTASFGWTAGVDVYVAVAAVDANGLKTICTNVTPNITVAADTVTQEKIATPVIISNVFRNDSSSTENASASGNGLYQPYERKIELSCATADVTIRYTTDNWASSTDYTGAFWISGTTTVKVKAVKAGMTDSDEVSQSYTRTVIRMDRLWDAASNNHTVIFAGDTLPLTWNASTTGGLPKNTTGNIWEWVTWEITSGFSYKGVGKNLSNSSTYWESGDNKTGTAGQTNSVSW